MTHALSLPVLTDATFADAVAPGSGLVAIEFSAEWCAPCRVMAPIVESVAQEMAGSMKVYQLDNDANPATAARLGVRGLPTMLLFRDGELVDRIIGAVSAPVLRERIAKFRPRPTRN